MSGYQAGVQGLWRDAVPWIEEPDPPDAGAGYLAQLDGRWWWRLEGCVFTLSTDATMGDRLVTVEMVMADGVALVIGEAPVLVTESTSDQRFVGSVRTGSPSWNTGTDVLFSLLDYPFQGGRSFAINIAGVQAGDQLTSIKLAWMRLPTNESIVRQYRGEWEW